MVLITILVSQFMQMTWLNEFVFDVKEIIREEEESVGENLHLVECHV